MAEITYLVTTPFLFIKRSLILLLAPTGTAKGQSWFSSKSGWLIKWKPMYTRTVSMKVL